MYLSLYLTTHNTYSSLLNRYKLSEDPIFIQASYTPSRSAQVPARISVRDDSFPRVVVGNDATEISSSHWSATTEVKVKGFLKNMNTLEGFKSIPKKSILNESGSKLWEHICNGDAEKDPSLLVPFFLLSYSDLKKHRYLYWFAFPALVLAIPPSIQGITSEPSSTSNALPNALPEYHLQSPPQSMVEALSESELISLWCSMSKLVSTEEEPSPFYLIQRTKESTVNAEGTSCLNVFPLSAWEAIHGGDNHGGDDHDNNAVVDPQDVWVLFRDPCALATNPGWPLRNLLVLASVRWKIGSLRVLCFREIWPPATTAMQFSSDPLPTAAHIRHVWKSNSIVLDISLNRCQGN